ncbi:MAG TPA: hypothetical protein VKZ58_04085 [Longimicrobiales bacterium]|nr:hypothetical protein [Longimicrobiales bacterium]
MMEGPEAGDWAGIALALRDAGEDRLRSRVPTYLHPLAGRILAWHVLRALATLSPPPRQLLLVTAVPVDPAVVAGLPAGVVPLERKGGWSAALEERLEPSVGRLLFVDATAAALSTSLAELRGGPTGRVLRGAGGEPLAVWLDRSEVAGRVGNGGGLEALASGCEETVPGDPGETFAVRDRAALARAGVIVRDRIVRALMDEGVTFLLPETVLVDVDVTVGPDTVIYPGVVLEGATTIGSETVIGPGCRIIDSRIGSGVELKGWNYIVSTAIRNRAVLEPYVRRGHD